MNGTAANEADAGDGLILIRTIHMMVGIMAKQHIKFSD
jgi:hypothetical protein